MNNVAYADAVTKDVVDRWCESFGEFPPIGSFCRDELPARWLRIHSLPESKRYPGTEPEYRELLRRHNEVATTLLGDGDSCILFAATSDDDPPPSLAGLTFVEVPDLSALQIHIAAAQVPWRPGRFDALIRAVADETAGPFLFANFERRTAYAPYDGGADLFLASPDEVVTMKARWSGWLSARPDGL